MDAQLQAQDKPADWVADCSDIFCGKPIHFGDRAIQLGEQYFCDERCFVAAHSAKPVLAGTETLTV